MNLLIIKVKQVEINAKKSGVLKFLSFNGKKTLGIAQLTAPDELPT